MHTKKKIAALLLASLLISGVFAGCAPSAASGSNDRASGSTASATDAEPITLTMMESFTGPERTVVLEDLAARYEETHPNVTIEIVSPPLENADQKIAQTLMAEQKCDIVEVHDNTIAQFAGNGWLADLESYIENWEYKSTIIPSAEDTIRIYDDTAYVMPYGFYHKSLFYRKDWFEQAGLEVPTTWQEVYEAGKALTDAGKSQFGFSFRGGSYGFQIIDALYFSYIGTEKLADNSAAYFTSANDGSTIFTLPEAKEALNFYKQIFEDISAPDSINWAYNEMVQSFVGGTSAMLIQDPEVLSVCMDSMDSDTWAVAPVPVGPSGESVIRNSFGGWAMTSYTEYPEQAADFILFLSNPENNALFAKNYSVIPIHSNAAEIDEYFNNEYFRVYTEMAEQPDVYKLVYTPQAYDAFAEYRTTVDAKYQQFLKGEITDDEMLQWLDDFWKKAYEEEGQKW